ncbi:MAG: DUF3817 domain-containing protein [Acidimicrobiales bacterium]
MTTTPTTPSLHGATAVFRGVAYVEAVTYLLLLGAVVVKRVLDGPDYVNALGPVHGVAFLIYLTLVLVIRESQGWGLWRTVLVVVLAAVPFGGFWAGRHLSAEPIPATGR